MSDLTIAQVVAALKDKLPDENWRLNNLYWIIDKDGDRVKFKLNAAQDDLLRNMHKLNVILKARQLGFSTFIDIWMLDRALFRPNTNCGLITLKLEDAKSLLQSKMKYPYENLPQLIRDQVRIVKSNEAEITFSNNSSIVVGTSLRGRTLQAIHVSEYGKISARDKEQADEVATGSLNAISAGNYVFVESTAEGTGGRFHSLVEQARSHQNRGKKLSLLDYKFHFYPWWGDPTYVDDPDTADLTAEDHKYFAKLAEEHNIHLTPAQKAWWTKKLAANDDKMFREYPSHPDEAFAATLEGSYFKAQLAILERQGRVTAVPFNPALGVETWWDLGINDKTVIIFVQRTKTGAINIIDCYASADKTLGDYANILRNRADDYGYRYSRHVMPHDVKQRDISADGRDRKSIAESYGIRPITVAPKLDVSTGIDKARDLLKLCYFDESRTDELFRALAMYRKDWNDRLGVWSDRPRHDDASHYADAFRYGAVTPPPEDIGFDRPLQVRRFGAV